MADQIKLGIGVTANTDQAKGAFVTLEQILKDTKKEAEESGRASEAAGKKEEEAAKKAAEAAKEQAQAQKQATEATAEAAKTASEAAQAQNAQAEAAKEQAQAQAEAAETAAALAEAQAELADQSEQAASSASSLASALSESGASDAAGDFSETAEALDDAAGSTDAASSSISQLNSILSVISPGTAQFTTNLLAAGSAVNLLQAAAVAAKTAMSYLWGTYKEAEKVYSSLEQASLRLGKMQQDAQLTADSVAAIWERSRSSGTSVNDLAQAAEVISRAGGNFRELIAYIEETATATGKSLPEVASIITKAMQGSSKAVMQLQMQLGISAEDLAAFGAELDENGEIAAKTTSQQEALADAVKAFVEANYFGSLAEYAETAAGATDNYRAAVERLKKTYGEDAVKSISSFKNALADLSNWLVDNKSLFDDFFGMLQGDQVAIAGLSERFGKLLFGGETTRELYESADAYNKAVVSAEKARYDARKKEEETAKKIAAERAEADRKAAEEAQQKAQQEQEAQQKIAALKQQQAEREAQQAAKRQEAEERRQRQQAEREAQEEARERAELAHISKKISMETGTRGTAQASAEAGAAKTDKFAGFNIGINKETGSWEWQPDQSKKFEGFNLVKNKETGSWEWQPDQSKKFEGLVPYQTEAGTWDWRKSTLQNEAAQAQAQAQAQEQAAEAAQSFADAAENAGSSLESVSSNLADIFQRLSDAAAAVYTSFGNVSRSAESVANYNYQISNSVSVDNRLSSGMSERQIIESASAIAERKLSANLDSSQVIGNSTGFLF
jgi:hypothetical protein